MAGLPLLITAATIAYTVFCSDEASTNGSSSNSRTTPFSQSLSTRPHTSFSSTSGMFFVGAMVGMSMTWIVSYETKRLRLWEHVRLKFLSWLYDDNTALETKTTSSLSSSPRLVDKFREPTLLTDLKGAPISRDGALCATLEFLSPDWTLSSGMRVDVLNLPSGTELVPSASTKVEFYYVVKGNGQYSRNGETHWIRPGHGFLVDPGIVRGFVVRGTGSLVMVRAADGPLSDGNNVTRLQTNTLSSATSLVTAGINKIHQVVEAANSLEPQISRWTPSATLGDMG